MSHNNLVTFETLQINLKKKVRTRSRLKCFISHERYGQEEKSKGSVCGKNCIVLYLYIELCLCCIFKICVCTKRCPAIGKRLHMPSKFEATLIKGNVVEKNELSF